MSTLTNVLRKMVERCRVGESKYGVHIVQTTGDATYWLTHLQEELLDGALYVQKVLEQIQEENHLPSSSTHTQTIPQTDPE